MLVHVAWSSMRCLVLIHDSGLAMDSLERPMSYEKEACTSCKLAEKHGISSAMGL